MNNRELQAMVFRQRKMIKLLAMRLEQYCQQWTDIAKGNLTRAETEEVQKFINDHLNYPEDIVYQ